jgi:hypothetical protein
MNTTGRRPRSSSSMRMSLSMAPVAPEPQRTTMSSGPPLTASWMTARACSRSSVVHRPVAEASVWVLPYSGSTCSRMKSSTKPSERPEAVASA